MLIERAVAALGARGRAAFYSLAQEPLHGERKTAHGVWLTNALPMVDACPQEQQRGDSGGDESAVFEEISRLNHACLPSAHAQWHAGLGRLTLHAARPVRRGEELTIPYHGVDGAGGMPRSERQEYFLGRFGFACGCAACGLTGAALAASDARQRSIRELTSTLVEQRQATRAPPFSAAAERAAELVGEVVREVVRLMRAEGMPPAWAKRWCVDALMVAAHAGDHKAAARWTREVAECVRTAGGDDCAEYRAITNV